MLPLGQDGDVTTAWVKLAFDLDDATRSALGPARNWAFIEMTGVLAAYRRRGIAGAMKRHAFRTARAWGCADVRTVHHPENSAIIAANLALGFRPAEFDL